MTASVMPVGDAPALAPTLPAGWQEIPSRTRPGEVSYLNTLTGRRVLKRPVQPAVDSSPAPGVAPTWPRVESRAAAAASVALPPVRSRDVDSYLAQEIKLVEARTLQKLEALEASIASVRCLSSKPPPSPTRRAERRDALEAAFDHSIGGTFYGLATARLLAPRGRPVEAAVSAVSAFALIALTLVALHSVKDYVELVAEWTDDELMGFGNRPTYTYFGYVYMRVGWVAVPTACTVVICAFVVSLTIAAKARAKERTRCSSSTPRELREADDPRRRSALSLL